MDQELRVQLEISVNINAKHDAKTVEEMVWRASRRYFPNNSGTLLSLRYAEEAAIYSHGEGHDGPKWTQLIRPTAAQRSRDALVKAEAFIAGFEDDDTQEGIAELLALIRSQLPLPC